MIGQNFKIVFRGEHSGSELVVLILVITSKASFDLLSGIPQGGTLGLTLFTVWINGLPDCSQKGSCKIFANDPKIYNKSSVSVSQLH